MIRELVKALKKKRRGKKKRKEREHKQNMRKMAGEINKTRAYGITNSRVEKSNQQTRHFSLATFNQDTPERT